MNNKLNTTQKESTKSSVFTMNKEKRYEILTILRNKNPNPKSELNYSNPFELLCAVVLSAQATDESVNKVTPQLFKEAPNPKAMSLLGEANIANLIKSIGLYRAKAKNLAKLATIIHEKYNDIVPNDYNNLIALPGVGSKTAKVVLNVAFGMPTIAVDTHIFRVCNRTSFCKGKSPKEVEDKIISKVPDEFKKNAHHYILLHGRYTCKALKPDCANCEINHLCNSYKTGKFVECKEREAQKKKESK